MKPRVTAALTLCMATLLFCACATVEKPETTPAPTAEITAAPTDELTAAPTEELTAAPTEELTAVPTGAPAGRPTAPPDYGEMPSFPGSVQLGKLIEGEIFPESAKYLVIPGESGLHYVYDRNGELVDTFLSTGCMSDADGQDDMHGLYGAYGICHGYSLKDKTSVDWVRFYFQGKCFMRYGLDVYEVRDISFENPMRFSGDPDSVKEVAAETGEPPITAETCSIGLCGCIFKLDDRYLALNAWPDTTVDYGDDDYYRKMYACAYASIRDARLYDENLRFLDEPVNYMAFGKVSGVFGDRYIFAENAIFTLDGERVMENVELVKKGSCPFDISGHFTDDSSDKGEITYIYGDYIVDENGVYYDRDLNIVDGSEVEISKPDSIYDPIVTDDRVFTRSGVYAGIKDGEGNWIFRIYDPRSTNDGLGRESWPEWFWQWYWDNLSIDE